MNGIDDPGNQYGPLNHASANGKLDMVRLLLDRGAAVDWGPLTALQCVSCSRPREPLHIDVADLLIFLSDYGCLSGCTADFNGDDLVNVNDLLIFLSSYGSFCF